MIFISIETQLTAERGCSSKATLRREDNGGNELMG